MALEQPLSCFQAILLAARRYVAYRCIVSSVGEERRQARIQPSKVNGVAA